MRISKFTLLLILGLMFFSAGETQAGKTSDSQFGILEDMLFMKIEARGDLAQAGKTSGDQFVLLEDMLFSKIKMASNKK